MSLHELRPLKQLNEISKVYPDTWKRVEGFMRDRGKTVADWPKSVFLPLAGWAAIVCAESGVEELSAKLNYFATSLAAIGTWRYTQGVYRFDPDFSAEIAETDLKGGMPVDVLFRLPEWCIYVETPGHDFGGEPLHGFYAHLEHDTTTQCWHFRFLLDMEEALAPFIIHLGPWTLREGIERAVDEVNRRWSRMGVHGFRDVTPVRNLFANADKYLAPLLSMVLYLCSEEPEIEGPLSGRPSQPTPKKTRKGMRLFAPNRPTIWKIGSTTGQLLRTARSGTSELSGGRSPCAHVRRAHWHGYWLGPKDAQIFQYRWLPPTFVSGEADPDPTQKAA